MSFRTLFCVKSCLVRRITAYQCLRKLSSTLKYIKEENKLYIGILPKMETRSMQKRKIAEKAASQSSLVVGHDKNKKEFYVKLPSGPAARDTKAAPRAILQYAWIRDKYVDLYHTGVPEEFRGRGVAKILAEAALDHFVEEDVTMRLSCTYLQYHMEKYPIPRIMEKIDTSG